ANVAVTFQVGPLFAVGSLYGVVQPRLLVSSIVGLQSGPDLQRQFGQLLSSGLHLYRCPAFKLGKLPIEPNTAIRVAARLEIALLQEWHRLQLRVEATQREVAQAMQPSLLDVAPLLAENCFPLIGQ